jgi:hypothetical protein
MNVSRSGISKFIFFCKKPIYKGWWVAKRLFVRPWTSKYEKSIAIIACGKCLVQASKLSPSCLSF